jgi:hypothetical protein
MLEYEEFVPLMARLLQTLLDLDRAKQQEQVKQRFSQRFS